MNKDYEYKVISASNSDLLTDEVNDSLQEGWELYGFPFGSGGGGGAHFCQAVIRRRPDGRLHDR
jgi:hypothetical protein